jgi:hypothetical protein
MTSGAPQPKQPAYVLALANAGVLSATELYAWVDAQVAASEGGGPQGLDHFQGSDLCA